MVIGDFNEIMEEGEKIEGNPKLPSQMEEFRTVINECALMDMGFFGHAFTWNNKRRGAANIQERLDRGLCTLSWKSHFGWLNASI